MREIKDNNSMYTLNQEEIQMYLKDLRQIDVMTPAREKELSEIMCSENCTEEEKDKVNQLEWQNNSNFKGP